MTAGWLDHLARLWPAAVDPPDSLGRTLRFLGVAVPAETVVRAARVLAVVAAVCVGLAGRALGAPPAVTLLAATALGAAVARVGPHVPTAQARLRRTRALGAAPHLVGLAVLRMRLAAVPETAAAFAARTGQGTLADSLERHVRRAAGTPHSGLRAFGREWRSWYPALGRSTDLLSTAATQRGDDRAATLDRARRATLDGARERLATSVERVRRPATALYAFGVLVPLSLVGALPAATAAGLPVTAGAIVLVYDLVLPGALLGATAWLLLRRPVAFPPPRVDRGHPDVPDRRPHALGAGCAVALGAWLLAPLVLPGWTRGLAAAGGGVGTALAVAYHPHAAVRERVLEVEAGLPDTLALVGRRVGEGESVEHALAAVPDSVGGAAGSVAERAVQAQETAGLGVEASLVGSHGALAAVPGRRAASAGALLAVAADVGRPAGPTLEAAADHLSELRAVEREARRDLAQVTATLGNTAAVFGPLVAGATVSMAAGMEARALGGGVETATLGPAVGAYALVLAAVLVTLSTGLERGLDPALVGRRVGWALLAATVTFLVAVRGTALLV